MFCWASVVVQIVKNPPAMQETQVPSLGQENALERGMAISVCLHQYAWERERVGEKELSLFEPQVAGILTRLHTAWENYHNLLPEELRSIPEEYSDSEMRKDQKKIGPGNKALSIGEKTNCGNSRGKK